MTPVPLAPYVQIGVLYPQLDAVKLAEETYQTIPVPIAPGTRSEHLDAVGLAQRAFEPPSVEPRIALVSNYNVILATVERQAWDIFERTPMAKDPSEEFESARREIVHAIQGLPDADLLRATPWDVVLATARKLTERSAIAGNILETLVAGRPGRAARLGFIGFDPRSLETLKKIALLRIREKELLQLHLQHLQAFLAGQAPFDGIAAGA